MKNLFFRTNVAPYRVDTYNALHDKYNFELYFFSKEDKEMKIDNDALYGKCHFIPHILQVYPFGSGNRRLCKGLFKILKENKPDCVIVPEFKILTIQILFLRLFLRKKPKVISMCDDSYDMINNDNDFTFTHKLARNIVVRWLDDIIVVEPRVQQWYQKHFHKGIWLPIIRDDAKESKHYENLVPLSNEYNKKNNLEGKRVVLFVGRLVALKNVSTLISAVDKVESDCVLVIVGDGTERENLEKQAAKCSKRVIFTGLLDGDNLHAWYNIADVFCLLSYQEAFGAVVNEALLSGCHTIVSSHAGSSCLIDEINGAIVEPMDVEGWTKAIDKHLLTIGEKDKEIKHRKHKMNVFFKERIENLQKHLY